MNTALVDRVVQSVLYEGYLLYPYRRAIKNVKRWTFGTIYASESREVSKGGERCTLTARCLVAGQAALRGQLRFLRLSERREASDDCLPGEPWHEAEEQRVDFGPVAVADLAVAAAEQPFELAGRQWTNAEGEPAGAPIVWRQQTVSGTIQLRAEPVGAELARLSVTVTNRSPVEAAALSERASSLLGSMASVHVVLHVSGGEFLSRIDPPADCRDLCPQDMRDGLWPVLVGEAGQRDTLLCSPIILYDYPEVAPESPGDYFDATEIDEMLALRVLTLSDEEKREVAALDTRGRELLRRTEQLAQRQLARLHGARRSYHAQGESGHGK